MDSDINENLSDSLSFSERTQFVKENKLCFSCLSKTHMFKDCKSSFIWCEKNCDKKHHMLLHEPPNVNVNNNFMNDLCTENEYLQREVSHLGNI